MWRPQKRPVVPLSSCELKPQGPRDCVGRQKETEAVTLSRLGA